MLLKSSKPAEALLKAQSGFEKSSEDPESWIVLAACLGANQRDLEALPLIESALKVRLNYAEAFASRAIIRLRSDNTTGAIGDLEKACALKPHLTHLWELLGTLCYKSKNLPGAIEALKKAQALEPDNLSHMINLGEFLRQDQRIEEAIAILEDATEKAPENASAWINLGAALQQNNKNVNAEVAYKKALAIRPNSAEIISNLGAIAFDARDWQLAQKYFEQAIAIKPNFPEAYFNLGKSLYELGNNAAAETSFRKAIVIKPKYAEAHSYLGMTQQELGRLHEAEKSHKEAISIKPYLTEALFNFSITLIFMEKLDEATQALQKIISINPSNIGLKASVNLAILEYLKNNKTSSKALILNSIDILNYTDSNYKSEIAYWNYLSALLNTSEKFSQNSKDQLDINKIYVIGESHSLSSHGILINKDENQYLCQACWIVGCKQWHLGNFSENKYKYKFKEIIKTIPSSSNILLAFGEIDCRIDSGLFKKIKKITNIDDIELINTTINNYFNYVSKLLAPFSHEITIQGVPCPNIENNNETLFFEWICFIKKFNIILRRQSQIFKFNFLDLYELTDRGDGFSNAKWHIDTHHISPAGIAEAWRTSFTPYFRARL